MTVVAEAVSQQYPVNRNEACSTAATISRDQSDPEVGLQQISASSLCGWIQRLRVVFHVAGNQRRFAGVAGPGSTGPPHSHIACFCKFEQALVFCIPRQRQSAPRERNMRSGTRWSRRQMRRIVSAFIPGVMGSSVPNISV